MKKEKVRETREYAQKVLGIAPDNKMRGTRGMDDIDMWAMEVGQKERRLRQMTPRRLPRKKKALAR